MAQTPIMVLCEPCQQLDEMFAETDTSQDKDGPDTKLQSLLLHTSFVELEACAAAGCKSCRGIRKYLILETRSMDAVKHLREHKAGLYFGWHRHPPPADLDIYDRDPVLHKTSDYKAHLYGTLTLPWYGDTRGRQVNIPCESTDEKVFTRVRDWLHECVLHHPACRRAMKVGQMPQRLLEIATDATPEQRVRLISPEGRPLRYCALSYCWGPESENFARTTSHNLQSRYDGFEAHILPKTIQDAVHVCSRLGISYLWVDALCIVQDQLDDWTHEASRMADVYGNAVLTVAAVSSQHANEGILWPRESDRYPITSWQLGGTIFGFEDSTELGIQGELMTRAWALQEEYMSSRVVYWTLHGLMWSCHSGLQTEWDILDSQNLLRHYSAQMTTEGGLGMNFVKEYSIKRRISLDRKIATRSTTFFRGEAPQAEIRKAWEEALRSFFNRNITRSSDRLPALSGLATMVQRQTGDRYLAGLWRDHLLHDLLWYNLNNLNGYRPPKSPHSPSWSWASYPALGIIGLDTDLDPRVPVWHEPESLCTFLEAKLDVPGADASDGPDTYSLAALVHAGRLKLNVPLWEQLPESLDVFKQMTKDVLLDTYFDYEGGDGDYDTLYWMAIITYPRESIQGLMVEKIDVPQQGEANERYFRRIGVFQISAYWGEEFNFDELLKRWNVCDVNLL